MRAADSLTLATRDSRILRRVPKYQALPGGANDRVGAVAGALAKPHRRAIVTRLCRAPATTSELAAETGVALPTVHQHLERLRSAGLIRSSKDGRTVTHCADLAPMAELESWIAARRAFWSTQLAALADSLADPLGETDDR